MVAAGSCLLSVLFVGLSLSSRDAPHQRQTLPASYRLQTDTHGGQYRSRCESWCEGKVGKQECGKDINETCTREEVCSFGNGVKCADCGMCKASTAGCEEWCPEKIGNKECDGGKTWCTWEKVCAWASGKCSGCAQCKRDPLCRKGVRHKAEDKRICCNRTCGEYCGELLCAGDGEHRADCCLHDILSAGKLCSVNMPPCVDDYYGENNNVKSRLGPTFAILMILTAAT